MAATEGKENIRMGEALLWLLGLLLVGIGFRVLYARYAFVFDIDTATVGYMARNILNGDRPLFFYGQNYMGALEAYTAAGFIALFGPREWVVALSTIFYTAAWIIGTYLLFSEIANRRTGLWLAAFAAAPGYSLMRYTTEPYGGYSVALFCGTMTLWLAVRIQRRHPRGETLFLHTIGMGLFAGLGLWTHLSVAPYLAVAGILCLVHLFRTRSGGVIFAYLAGAVIAAQGLLPGWIMRDQATGGHTTSFTFTSEHLSESWRILLEKNLDPFLSWDLSGALHELGVVASRAAGEPFEEGFKIAVIAVLAVGLLAYLAIAIARRQIALFVPLLLCLVFLASFLPHTLAHEPSPRYILTFWSGGIIGMAGIGLANASRTWPRWLRTPTVALQTALALFLLVIGFLGQEEYTVDKSRHGVFDRAQSERRGIAAQATGVDAVHMVSGDFEAHRGQIYSFYSGGKPPFLSTFDERVGHMAQDAELGRDGWFVDLRAIGNRVQSSFDELDTKWISNYSPDTIDALIYQQHPDHLPANPVLRLIPQTNITMTVLVQEEVRHHPQNPLNTHLTVQKFAYAGHNETPRCTEDPKTLPAPVPGQPVTYCYRFTNIDEQDIVYLHMDDVHLKPPVLHRPVASKIQVGKTGTFHLTGTFPADPDNAQATLHTDKLVLDYRVHRFRNHDKLLDQHFDTKIRYLLALDMQLKDPIPPGAATGPIIWSFSQEPLGNSLPFGYNLYTRAPGGKDHKTNACHSRIAQNYRIGRRLFFKGYFPRQDIQVNPVPVPVDGLKLVHNGSRPNPWKMNELLVFAPDPDGAEYTDTSAAFDTAKTMIEDGKLDFVIADRVASATLLRDCGPGVAYPRYNSKFPATMPSRTVRPRARLGLLVHSALADTCRDLLTERHGNCILDLNVPENPGGTDPYTLIVLRNCKSDDRTDGLAWNGHTLLKMDDPNAFRWH